MPPQQKSTPKDPSYAAAVKDRQMVTAAGDAVTKGMPHGMSFRPTPIQLDDRGKLVEMYDPRWNWHPDPLVYVYYSTLRPNVVKGWALHETHEDRYFVVSGHMELVTYDIREDSPTYKQVHRITLSGDTPGILNIPIHVWHADVNVGDTEVFLANMPTLPYDHANPDKLRLPLDTPHIPYDFPAGYRGY